MDEQIRGVCADYDIFLGTCPYGGLILLDGYVHVGTFCADGTATLPVGQYLHMWTEEIILIQFR